MNQIRTSLVIVLHAFALLGLPAAADDGSDHALTTNITINHFNGHGLFSPHPNNCDPDDEVFIEVEHIEADGTEATGFCVERTVRPAATWSIAILRCLHQEKRLPEVDEFFQYICPYRDERGNPLGAPADSFARGVEWLSNQSQTIYREGTSGSDGSGLTATTAVPRGNIRDCAYSDLGTVAQSAGGALSQSRAYFRCVH